MQESVLVIAAHPDDEVIGCGGTIAKHLQNGDIVNILIVVEGQTSRQNNRNRDSLSKELKELQIAGKEANKLLGAKNLNFLDFPDNRLDSIDRLDLIKAIEINIKRYNPSTIYTHHAWDLNIDHRRLHEAVITASRPIPGQIVKKILCFEIPSSTEWQSPGIYPSFTPNYFVDITDQINLKIKALEEYESEMREWPHARSIRAMENLIYLRGSQVGVEAAEAFYLVRQLV